MNSQKLLVLLSFIFLAIPLAAILILKTNFNFNNVLGTKTKSYSTILVGDSMTAALGSNTPELKADLKKYFPSTTFNISNYSKGSTNILTLDEKLNSGVDSMSQTLPPALQQNFDLIIIESFGHNPLSQFPLAEGLNKQTQALDSAVSKIRSTHPNSKIVFLATIAPNRNRYAENTVNLLPQQRNQWADERTAYIQNHINYAKSHNIPLINVYQKSLKNGTGNLDYVSPVDFIHPSTSGVYLIAQSIADFIYQNKLIR